MLLLNYSFVKYAQGASAVTLCFGMLCGVVISSQLRFFCDPDGVTGVRNEWLLLIAPGPQACCLHEM